MAQPKGNNVLYEFLSISWEISPKSKPIITISTFLPAGATSDGRNCKKTLCILTGNW